MPRYQLTTEEAQPTGEIEEISLKDMLNLAVKKQMSFLLGNSIAVKGSVEVEKFNRKFSLEWTNAKTGLLHKQSYVPYIAGNGDIRNKKVGSLSVTKGNTQSE